MAEWPAFPVWTDAYLGDTTHLTTIEHGAYLLLLFAMWRTREKKLPSDDVRLARYAKLTSGQWSRMRSTIMEFFDEIDGFITQGRLTDEAVAVRQHSKRQSDNAKSRWLKDNESSNAMAMPNACQTHAPLPLPLEETYVSKKDTVSKGSRLPPDWKPSRENISYAESIGLGQRVSRISLDFAGYWKAKAGKDGVKLDWDATWEGWCRREADRLPPIIDAPRMTL